MTFKPGFDPIEHKVLLFPDVVDEKTEGGIILPDMVKDKEQDAVVWATVVSMSPLAFNYDDDVPTPEVGDKVMIPRYAGKVQKGQDGKLYRITSDRDIQAIKRGNWT